VVATGSTPTAAWERGWTFRRAGWERKSGKKATTARESKSQGGVTSLPGTTRHGQRSGAEVVSLMTEGGKTVSGWVYGTTLKYSYLARDTMVLWGTAAAISSLCLKRKERHFT